MSEKIKKTEVAKTGEAKKSFAYRNIKKDFTKFGSIETTSKQFHIELGENYETKIVQDRDVDWFELAQRDVSETGLAHVLEVARKRGDPLDAFIFKDGEAIDISSIDPDNPAAMESLGKLDESQKKLEALAKQLGLTSSELVNALLDGTLSDKIASAVKPAEKNENKEVE